MNKTVVFGEEARNIIQKSVNILCDAVKITLGPHGRNVILVSDYTNPKIINDGVTIAKEIELENELENIGASIVKEAAIKTNEVVGDGTTTTLVLLQDLYNRGVKLINDGYNPVKLNKELNESLNLIIKFIKQKSKNNISINDIKNIAVISSENKQIGCLISKAIKTIGKTGNIIIEDNANNDISLEFVNGMEIKNGYISNSLLTENTLEIELLNTKVYIINKYIDNVEDLKSLNINNNILLLGEDFSEEIIDCFSEKNKNSENKVILVKLTSYGEKRKEIIKDIKVFIDNKNLMVKVYKDKTLLINEKINESKIKERMDYIKKEMIMSDSEFEKELFEERIFNLLGKNAIIKVGAQTELEQIERKMRITDAICAVKSAINGGISIGGGLTYFYASSNLKESLNTKGSVVLSECLKSPLKQILYNNGIDDNIVIKELINKPYGIGYDAENEKFVDMINEGIVDSTNVLIESLKSCVSITTMLLTSDVIVVNNGNKNCSNVNINESL